MNISELIKELETIKEEHGELDVTIFSDHGQWNTPADCIGIQYIDDGHDVYAEEDIVDYDDLIKVVEISG